MKKKFRKVLGIFLSFILFFGGIPMSDFHSHDDVHGYEAGILDWFSLEVHAEWEEPEECEHCGGKIYGDWICDGGTHCGEDSDRSDCYEEWHCTDCGDCIDNTDELCDECGDCLENCCDCDNRCDNCGEHSNSLCQGCYEKCSECAEDELCSDCGEYCVDCMKGQGDGYWCDDCGICIGCAGTICEGCDHCSDCATICEECGENCTECSDWICESCGKCSDCVGDTDYCQNCDICIDCAGGYVCYCQMGCSNCANICEGCEEKCTNCAPDDICSYCLDYCKDCVGDDNWCSNCDKCRDCAGYICECGNGCGECTIICECEKNCENCTGLICSGCGMCYDCVGDAGWCDDCNNCGECVEVCFCGSGCSDCATVCPECNEKCTNCGDAEICGGCNICKDCAGGEGYFCDNCETCINCATHICYCGNGCSECSTVCEGCLEQCENCTGEICAGCGYCSDCSMDYGWCSNCDMCGYCVIVCYCGNGCEDCGTVCPDCNEKCTECAYDEICGSCNLCKDCVGGDGNFCDNCGTCVDCAEYVCYCGNGCSECAVVCPDCNETCTECAPEEICGGCNICKECAGGDGNFCDSCETCIDCAEYICICGQGCDGCALLCSECGEQCENCSEELCFDCGKCLDCSDADGFCKACMKCSDCTTNPCLCGESCDECGTVCEGCGEHCYECYEFFCDDCGYCRECTGEDQWCEGCNRCGGCAELCAECEMICKDCAQEWCEDCDTCIDCVDWYCPSCGICEDCADVICKECGYCGDCAAIICDSCGEICDSCAVICSECEICENCTEICAYCEYCIICCEENAEDRGCSHGICQESQQWKSHYCTIGNHCIDGSVAGQLAYDEYSHWYICGKNCSGKLNEQGHLFGKGVITKIATTRVQGIVELTCVDCGYTYEEKIPKVTGAHVHSFYEVVVPADCMSGGYTIHECDCGAFWMDSMSREKDHSYIMEYNANIHWGECQWCHQTLDDSQHVFGAWKVLKEPKYLQMGERMHSCVICDYTHVESIPTLPHQGRFVIVLEDGKGNVIDELLSVVGDKTVPQLPKLEAVNGKYFKEWKDKSTGKVVKQGDKMTQNVTVIPVWTESKGDVTKAFVDVVNGNWYVEAIQYVYDKGIMSGNNGLFNPTGNVTRAQVVQTLYNLEGKPKVTDYSAVEELVDVEGGQWYTDAVCWAYSTGITTGNDATKMFNMGTNVTRQQLATFIYRFAEYKGLDVSASSDISGMVGASDVADYAAKQVKWAVGAGLIKGSESVGTDGKVIYDLKPTGTATRAQMATILQRFCEANSL